MCSCSKCLLSKICVPLNDSWDLNAGSMTFPCLPTPWSAQKRSAPSSCLAEDFCIAPLVQQNWCWGPATFRWTLMLAYVRSTSLLVPFDIQIESSPWFTRLRELLYNFPLLWCTPCTSHNLILEFDAGSETSLRMHVSLRRLLSRPAQLHLIFSFSFTSWKRWKQMLNRPIMTAFPKDLQDKSTIRSCLPWIWM